MTDMKGTEVPLRRSRRLEIKGLKRKPITYREILERRQRAAPRLDPNDPDAIKNRNENVAQSALQHYNTKHVDVLSKSYKCFGNMVTLLCIVCITRYFYQGTGLEFVRFLNGMSMTGRGFARGFIERHYYWRHLNFEARRPDAGPKDEPLLLFAEVYSGGKELELTTLLLVGPTDGEYGCQRCLSYVNHPRRGFRAGFDATVDSNPKLLSSEAAAKLAEFALQDYIAKQTEEISLKFERAVEGNGFTSTGLLMDFTEKRTHWVHLNFEARVCPKEEVLLFFDELYLEDGSDDKYVLATFSPAEATWMQKVKVEIDRGCPCCPKNICHPWRDFRFAFNYPPHPSSPYWRNQ